MDNSEGMLYAPGPGEQETTPGCRVYLEYVQLGEDWLFFGQ